MSDSADLQLVHRRGVIELRGSRIQSIAKKYLDHVHQDSMKHKIDRDGHTGSEINFHVTVFDPLEVKNLDPNDILTHSSAIEIHDIGLAEVRVGVNLSIAYYVVIYSPSLQQLRKKVGLKEKDLHITLGFCPFDPHGSPSSTLMKDITLWNTGETASAVLSTLLAQPTSDSYLTHISYEQSKALLCQVSYYLLANIEFTKILNPLPQYRQGQGAERFTPTLSHFASAYYTPSETLDMLKDISKLALAYQLYHIVDEIGAQLLRCGYLFGLRLLMQSEYSQYRNIYVPLLSSFMPLTLHDKLQSNPNTIHIVRDLNEMIMSSSSCWEEEKRVFYYDQAKNRFLMPKLPRNFSWVKLTPPAGSAAGKGGKYQFVLAGSAVPSEREHLQALYGVGIRCVVSIIEHPLSRELTSGVGSAVGGAIDLEHVFCVDREVISVEEMKRVTQRMQRRLYPSQGEGQGVLVHCLGGVGRTNTLLISYMMRYQSKGSVLSAQKMTEVVQSQRKVLLSNRQVKFLKEEWWREMATKGGEIEEGDIGGEKGEIDEEEVESAGEREKKEVERGDEHFFSSLIRSLSLPPVLLLCGLPGSGKSSLSKALLDTYPQHFERINRDEMRGKGQLEGAFGDYMRAFKGVAGKGIGGKWGGGGGGGGWRKILLIDGCHITKEKRKEWVDAMSGEPIWCLHFNFPVEECIERAKGRVGHPTLPGHSAERVIKSIAKDFEGVEKREGFSRVITLSSSGDILREIITPWRVLNHPLSPTLFSSHSTNLSSLSLSNISEKRIPREKPLKFPRTPHALNLGAATRDDKVLSLLEVEQWVRERERLVIEEKVDGANMGISIIEGEIRVQNRSHYISGAYHAQFEQLDRWIEKHRVELHSILGEEERYILYGEWAYATHSVAYNRLDDWFIAYDLYDVQEERFWSRERLCGLLGDTSVKIVKEVFQGQVSSVQEIVNMVRGASHYGDSDREGIVIRVMASDHMWLKHRAKLVRSDFIAGNERWNKSSKLQKNQLALYDF